MEELWCLRVWLVLAATTLPGCGDAAATIADETTLQPTAAEAGVAQANSGAERVPDGGAAPPISLPQQPAAATPALDAGTITTTPRIRNSDDDADSGTKGLRELCSGCDSEQRDATDMSIHLHHVHLNVRSRAASFAFYEKFFKAERVLLNGTTEALHVAPTLLLLDEQATAPDGNLPSALQHMGWGSEDTAAWYAQAASEGVQPDTRGFTLFGTSETPTVSEPGSGALLSLLGEPPACFPAPDAFAFMYVFGPDQERIEVWSGVDGRVNHLHFTTPDLAATSAWYQTLLGLPSMTPLFSYQFYLDDILFFYEPIGVAADYAPTDTHTLGHLAFAVSDLNAWRTRVAQQGVEIVAEPAAAHGFQSFFVRGPDGLLLELVQAAKNSELCPP
jgi:catechol 2,3-dioxygenase-like lactoylglutathione lyase family enzyme